MGVSPAIVQKGCACLLAYLVRAFLCACLPLPRSAHLRLLVLLLILVCLVLGQDQATRSLASPNAKSRIAVTKVSFKTQVYLEGRAWAW